MTKEVVFDGTVARLEWRNPHISLTVATRAADGSEMLHDVEVMSVSEARAMGLTPEAIAQGSHVVVRAHPGRSGPAARAVGLDVRTSGGALLPLNTDAGIQVPAAVAEARSVAGRWAPSVAEFNNTIAALFGWPLTESARESLMRAATEPGALVGICADYPAPLLAVFPDLREIEVGASTVNLRFEAQGQDVSRVVHLDQAAHSSGIAPALHGHSIGRWEGQTLVVDTVAFTPHEVGVVFGVQSSAAKHLVERFTLAEDRRRLRYELTLEDPAALTGPASLSMQWEYRPDLSPSGVTCDPDTARELLER
jgi:hypothetical protein